MKTFLLILLGIIAGIVILANLGPMILLVVSLVVSYYAVKKFILTNSVAEKVLWALVILIGISISISNIPALIGVVAFVVLYYTYKTYKQDKEKHIDDDYLMTYK